MRPLALTMGEPAGVGAEIAAGAWSALHATGPVFFLIDDATRRFAVPVRAITSPEEAAAAFPEALPVLHRPLPRAPVTGQPDTAWVKFTDCVASRARLGVCALGSPLYPVAAARHWSANTETRLGLRTSSARDFIGHIAAAAPTAIEPRNLRLSIEPCCMLIPSRASVLQRIVL